MTSHALPHDPTPAGLSRWVVAGAVCGAVLSLILHAGAFRLLPSAWLLPFWGGIWGAVLAATLARLGGARLLLGALAFGAVLPTLVAFILIAPFRGQPTLTGVVPLALLFAIVVNGAWGLGTGIGLALFGRTRAKVSRPD